MMAPPADDFAGNFRPLCKPAAVFADTYCVTFPAEQGVLPEVVTEKLLDAKKIRSATQLLPIDQERLEGAVCWANGIGSFV